MSAQEKEQLEVVPQFAARKAQAARLGAVREAIRSRLGERLTEDTASIKTRLYSELIAQQTERLSKP